MICPNTYPFLVYQMLIFCILLSKSLCHRLVLHQVDFRPFFDHIDHLELNLEVFFQEANFFWRVRSVNDAQIGESQLG